ncbi:unnamed protein product [Pylaiella littoralis]
MCLWHRNRGPRVTHAGTGRITGAKVASRGVNYAMLGVVFIALGIAKLATVYWEMDQRIPKSFFGLEGCTRHRGIMSPEDIIPVFEGVFVGSSDERRQFMMQSIGAEAAPWGDLFAIWNVDTPGQDPKTALLEIEGFPEGTAFHPHGMHYRAETGELFVVNHAYSQGGERIDVFTVSENFPQQALPSVHPSLLERTPPPPPPPPDEVEEEPAAADAQGRKGDPEVVDIGVAHAVLGGARGDGDGGEVGSGDGGGGGSGGNGAAAAGGTVEEGGAGAEGRDNAAEGEVEVEAVVQQEAEKTKEEEKVVEETPKEMATRLKREAKEAAAKAKADEKQRIAEEKQRVADQKAADKAAAAARAARLKGLAKGGAPFKLTYSFTIEHEVVTTNYGVLNDLVLASDDELYVTQFLAMRHPLHGPTQPDSIMEYLRMFGSTLCMLLKISPAPIIRCTGIRGADIACERLAKGRGAMYNGIALSPNGERLLVSDTMAMQMMVFNRSLETGALTLRQRLDLAGSPDNLEMDVYRAAGGEEAYTVGLVNGMDFWKYSSAMHGATHPSDGDEVKMAGGAASVAYDQASGKYESSLEMWHDGSLLSISSAASTASGARLLGSAVEDGFLLCRPPPCSLSESEEAAGGVCPWAPPLSTEEGNAAAAAAAAEEEVDVVAISYRFPLPFSLLIVT